MVVPWPIIAYDRAVVKNCLWPCQGHVLRDSNHSIYYCMICTGYSLLALSFMLEPFIQFGEYIVMKYRGKPQIDMWFSWCFALALDVWKTRACEITGVSTPPTQLLLFALPKGSHLFMTPQEPPQARHAPKLGDGLSCWDVLYLGCKFNSFTRFAFSD